MPKKHVRAELPAAYASFKSRIFEKMPGFRSSHLSEAIARGAGYRTHAAYASDLHGETFDLDLLKFDRDAMASRLIEMAPERTDAGALIHTTLASLYSLEGMNAFVVGPRSKAIHGPDHDFPILPSRKVELFIDFSDERLEALKLEAQADAEFVERERHRLPFLWHDGGRTRIEWSARSIPSDPIPAEADVMRRRRHVGAWLHSSLVSEPHADLLQDRFERAKAGHLPKSMVGLGIPWTPNSKLIELPTHIRASIIVLAEHLAKVRSVFSLSAHIAQLYAKMPLDAAEKAVSVLLDASMGSSRSSVLTRALDIMSKHAYQSTALLALARAARENNDLGMRLPWLSALDGDLWKILNTPRQDHCLIESAFVLSHFFHERLVGMPVIEPHFEHAAEAVEGYLRMPPIPLGRVP